MTGAQLREYLVNKGLLEKNLSFQDLAEKLNFSPQNLTKRLKVHSLKADFIQQVASVLGVPVAEVTGYEMPAVTMASEPEIPYGRTLQDRLISCLDSKEALYKKIDELHERLHKAEQELIQQQRTYAIEKIK